MTNTINERNPAILVLSDDYIPEAVIVNGKSVWFKVKKKVK
jgi:hypothetical protein